MSIKRILSFLLAALCALPAFTALPMRQRSRVFTRYVGNTALKSANFTRTYFSPKKVFNTIDWQHAYSKTWRGGITALKYGMMIGPITITNAIVGYLKRDAEIDRASKRIGPDNPTDGEIEDVPKRIGLDYPTIEQIFKNELKNAGCDVKNLSLLKHGYPATPLCFAKAIHGRSKKAIFIDNFTADELPIMLFDQVKQEIENLNIKDNDQNVEIRELIEQGDILLEEINALQQKSYSSTLSEQRKILKKLRNTTLHIRSKLPEDHQKERIPSKLRGILYHECGHLAHKDSLRSLCAMTTIPFITTIGYIFLGRLRGLASVTHTGWARHLFGSLFSVISIGLANEYLFAQYKKLIEETQADNFAIEKMVAQKDISGLQEFEKNLRYDAEKLREKIELEKSEVPKYGVLSEIMKGIIPLKYLILNDHPPSDKRAQLVQNAREELESQLQLNENKEQNKILN